MLLGSNPKVAAESQLPGFDVSDQMMANTFRIDWSIWVFGCIRYTRCQISGLYADLLSYWRWIFENIAFIPPVLLRLRAGPHESELRVTFDPGDTNTLRVHDANFVAGEYIEGELGHFRMPPWIYPVGGLLVLGVIVVLLEKRRKKKIKLDKMGSAKHHSSGTANQGKGGGRNIKPGRSGISGN